MFDGYTDAELVGEGGLGRLYRATRISTGGLVAIKELRDVSSASAAVHRARRELDALLKLKGHPYVVSVEEIIEGPNGPCLVMEYAPGGSLHDRVAGGPLSAPEVVLVGQHVTQALAAAHDQGIIHRDVKPHNLLIGTFGQVKVCDFGIAALLRGPSGRTQTQAFTLAYASPEELDGDGNVGPPADTYSFSATMVHLITGRRPTFRDRLAGSGLTLSLTTGDLDPVLRPVVGALRFGLAHDPEDRPRMDEFSQVFETAAADLGPRKIQRLSATIAPLGAVLPPPVGPPVDPDITDPRRHRADVAALAAGAAIIEGIPSTLVAEVGPFVADHLQQVQPLDSSGVTVDDSPTVIRTAALPAAAVVSASSTLRLIDPRRLRTWIIAASIICIAAAGAVWLGVDKNAGAERKASDAPVPTDQATTTLAPSTTSTPPTTSTTSTSSTSTTSTTVADVESPTSIAIVLPLAPETTATTPKPTPTTHVVLNGTTPPTAAPTTAVPTSPPPTQPPPTTVTTPPPPNYPTGDVNKDCVVNQTDIDIVQSDINTVNRRSDLNGDGIVDSTDLSIANSHRGETC